MMSAVVVVSLCLLSSACVWGQFGKPTSASSAECSALKAAIPNGDNCVVSHDCARLQCSTTVIFYPIHYNVTIHKCHHPVQVSLDFASSAFSWNQTFEGNQTVQLSRVPQTLTMIAGRPFVHVEMIRVKGGIVMSAALWFRRNGQWGQTIPIVKQRRVPLDTSDCPSIGYDLTTAKVDNSIGGSPNAVLPDRQQLLDLLKKSDFLKFFNKLNKGKGSTNGGSDKDTSLFSEEPLDPTMDYDLLPTMEAKDPILQMCIDQLLQQESYDYWMTDSPALEYDLKNCYCRNLKGVYGYSEACASMTDKSSDKKWYIIGGCIGGTVILAITVTIILFVIYMKKRVPTTSGVSYKELEEE